MLLRCWNLHRSLFDVPLLPPPPHHPPVHRGVAGAIVILQSVTDLFPWILRSPSGHSCLINARFRQAIKDNGYDKKDDFCPGGNSSCHSQRSYGLWMLLLSDFL
ncbi:hypothetical protein L1987_82042 [Smallanthus sonchifolius]|uniref:Uncharacterized protein n=1 Tax=Smallanthus sonchifolius TaxID=185202 RepID=A0ACB8YWC6_9ASTR|nr:hypothetical protein L1987_82042 [Smallanthus sonchifolius]